MSKTHPFLWLSALVVVSPLLMLALSWLSPEPELWAHLAEHLMSEALSNTLGLVCGTVLGVSVLGLPTGLLLGLCQFPGRRFFAVVLMLPLAFPPYVLAFVQMAWLNHITGFSALALALHSVSGAAVVLSLALYPYLLLLLRRGLSSGSGRSWEVAASLGLSRQRWLWKVLLPALRPWWLGALALVVLEVLCDFATVMVFNLDTFTTLIYKSWVGFFKPHLAAQIASLLVLLALLLFLALGHQRQQRQRYSLAQPQPLEPVPLQGWHKAAALLWCLGVSSLAVGLPLLQLLWWAAPQLAALGEPRYLALIGRSALLAGSCALLTVLWALWLSHIAAHRGARSNWVLLRLIVSGYAMPSLVLAVGFLLPWASWHAQFVALALALWVLALCTRFLAVAFEPLEAAQRHISPSHQHACHSLGLSRWQMLRQLYIPTLQPAYWGAFALVFVEVLKDMPITLMLRPFGWDTLAVRVFEMSTEGLWSEAALPASLMVAVAVVVLLANEWTASTRMSGFSSATQA